MSLFHRNSPYLAILTLGPAGLLALAIGALAMESRHSLATTLLGGKYFIGLPVERADSFKLMAVSYTSLEVLLVGVAMIGVGILLTASRLARDPALPVATGTPQGGNL